MSHLSENFDRVGLVHADYGGARAGRPPAVEHTGRGKAGENADQRHAAGGCHVLSGGIVAHVKTAARDELSEAGETPLPEGGAGSGTGDGAFDARGLFAAGALIDRQRGSGGEEGEELTFE